MKIAFLTPEYPHPKTGHSGGLGTSILNLATGLAKLGVKVVILVYQQDADAFIDEGEIKIYRIKNIKLKGLSWLLTRRKIQRKINALTMQGELDLVEAPDWTGITAYMRLQCPLSVKLHGSDTYFCHLDQRQVKARNRFFEKTALKKADAIISVSDFTGKLTKQLFQLKKDYTVIPNSIDLSKFSPARPAANENTILYFGTLIRKKGLLELPHIFNEVLERHPQARLLLVGNDSADRQSGSPSTWKLMKPLFSEKAIDRVQYLGPVPYSHIKTHIAHATVCVFPTFAEALPVSWIEAMAMEKAVVASNIGWAPEVIDDGKDGYLVHPKDHALFADRLVRVLNNEALRTQLGAEARRKVREKFSIEVVAGQSVAFYERQLEQHSRK
ncbi:MAG: glycoside hydrolase [Flavobacteriaceae bacterium]|nr:glycoside hydrolase [Flavobacteriaceae bacterium]